MIGASKQVNGKASGPVLPSLILVALNHSAEIERGKKEENKEEEYLRRGLSFSLFFLASKLDTNKKTKETLRKGG